MLLSNTKPPKNILQQLLHPDLAGDLPHGLQRPLDVLRWQEAKNMLWKPVSGVHSHISAYFVKL